MVKNRIFVFLFFFEVSVPQLHLWFQGFFFLTNFHLWNVNFYPSIQFLSFIQDGLYPTIPKIDLFFSFPMALLGLILFLIFIFILFIYLAMLGLSCGTQDLLLQRMRSSSLNLAPLCWECGVLAIALQRSLGFILNRSLFSFLTSSIPIIF